MSTFFVDFESGNDSNDGLSFANRWLTLTNGATAARIAPGDEIRIKATPYPTLVGDATWTEGSTTVTLASAVTQTIELCETAWTASTNVTADTSTNRKSGTLSASLIFAAGFTTGLAAYKTLGATLDLSGYQQVCFWLYSSLTRSDGDLTLRLCSDSAGVTTVNTASIPASPSGVWSRVVVDLGAALGSSIQSVALYAEVDPSAATILIDNIFASKASSANDSLTLNSKIAKIGCTYWQASTSYSLNDVRKPTPTNRNGLAFKVTTAGTSGSSEPAWPSTLEGTVTDGSVVWTAYDVEDTWYGIQSIDSTTIKLESQPSVSVGSEVNRGYHGETQTVPTYKREVFFTTAPGSSSANVASLTLNDAGTADSPITYSGGWNRTDMSTQDGETWLSGRRNYGQAFNLNQAYVTLDSINVCDYYGGFSFSTSSPLLKRCHVVNNNSSSISASVPCSVVSVGCGVYKCTAGIVLPSAGKHTITNCGASSNTNNGLSVSGSCAGTVSGGVFKWNSARGISLGAAGAYRLSDVFTNNNATGSIDPGVSVTSPAHLVVASNCQFSDAIATISSDYNTYFRYHNYQRTADDHRIFTQGATIQSATDQRNTPSGVSWKFSLTHLGKKFERPVVLPLAKVALSAGTAATLSIYTRRTGTDIRGKLVVKGGALKGIPLDVSVICAPSINTWVKSDDLIVTPTEAGVIDVEFWVWDGVSTANSFWIDDFSVSQA